MFRIHWQTDPYISFNPIIFLRFDIVTQKTSVNVRIFEIRIHETKHNKTIHISSYSVGIMP